MELTTGADLMLAMVYAQELGDWDYSGMYTAVLKHKVGALCRLVQLLHAGCTPKSWAAGTTPACIVLL